MASPQLQKEIERYKAWLEENPPAEAYDIDQGYFYWECPKCGSRHDSEEQATECCMPDSHDIDDHNCHSRRG